LMNVVNPHFQSTPMAWKKLDIVSYQI